MKTAFKDASGLTVKDQVEHVLTNHPEARDNDTVLEFLVLERYGFTLTPEQWRMVREGEIPKLETIRRHRADIQNADGRWQKKEFI